MTDRVRGFVNEFTWGLSRVIHPSLSSAEKSHDSDRLRTFEVVELREGETVVTREMRERIKAVIATHRRTADDPHSSYDLSLSAGARALTGQTILDILDGKDGQ